MAQSIISIQNKQKYKVIGKLFSFKKNHILPTS